MIWKSKKCCESKEGFVDKIGGKKDFDAIGGTQYNTVMDQSLKETMILKVFKVEYKVQ